LIAERHFLRGSSTVEPFQCFTRAGMRFVECNGTAVVCDCIDATTQLFKYLPAKVIDVVPDSSPFTQGMGMVFGICEKRIPAMATMPDPTGLMSSRGTFIQEPHDVRLARIELKSLDLHIGFLRSKAPLDFGAALPVSARFA
jgi:hypothetical protein